MKRSKFTSFLFSMVFGLFITAGLSAQVAAGSADCQDEVNITLGDNCDFAFDSLLVNSWKPSCLYIKDADGTTLVSVGDGTTGDCDCAIEVDSVSITRDTFVKSYTSAPIEGWIKKCGTTDTMYVLNGSISSAVSAAQGANIDNDAYALAAGDGFTCTTFTGPQDTMSNGLVVVELAADASKLSISCSAGITTIKDTSFTIMSTDTIFCMKFDTTHVDRFNEFSHETPLQWYPGAVIASADAAAVTMTGSGTKIPLGADATSSYTYHAYNPDCSNWCWGDINFEYKNTHVVTGGTKTDTQCEDYTDYSRGADRDYVANDNAFGVEFPRSTDSIEFVLNEMADNCISYTVTKMDRVSGDLCDDIVHIRDFTIHHPHSKIDSYAGPSDTVVVQAMTVMGMATEVNWPERVVTLQCNLIGDDLSPTAIAEYYASCGKGIVTKGEAAVDLGPLFESQYMSPPSDLGLTGFANETMCDKVVANADYNNYGVKRAMPYLLAREREDKWLKSKLSALEKSNNTSGVTPAHYTVDSLAVPINPNLCNVVVSYWDHKVVLCVGEYKVLRTWNAIDWCNGSTQEFVQTIHVVDDVIDKTFTMAPVEAKADDPWSCKFAMTIPSPGYFDRCSNDYVSISVKVGSKSTSVGSSFSFPLGMSTVTYTLTDDCGNTAQTTLNVTVIDKYPPAMVCTDELNVTLTGTAEGGGTAKVTPDMLNAGSRAGCSGELSYWIGRKSDIDYRSSFIALKAQQDDEANLDLSTGIATAMAQVGLSSTAVELDCDDQESVDLVLFAYNTATGYYSWCWSTVTVENKIPPVIVCEDVPLDCGDSIHPDWTGYPHAYAVCGEVDLTWEDEENLDALCYKGTITRTWTDNISGVQCVQILTITDDELSDTQFDPKTIKWPLHNTGETLTERDIPTTEIIIYDNNTHGECNRYTYTDYAVYRGSTAAVNLFKCTMDDAFECTIGGTNEPTWTDPTCGLVGMTSTDEEFTFNDGVCYKILRHWVVIDWCTYDPKDPNSDEVDNSWFIKNICEDDEYFQFGSDVDVDGYYTFTQEIKVVDDTPPVITGENVEVGVGAGNKPDADGESEACEGSIDVTATAEDFCGGDLVDGAELDWTVTVEAGSGSGKIVYPTGSSNGGNDEGEVPSNEGDYSSHTVTVTGEAGDVVTLKWRVTDGCNNVAEAVTTVTFIDDKAPVLLCYQDLSTNAMSTNGEAEVWAGDYGKAYDCDGEEVAVWFLLDEDGNPTDDTDTGTLSSNVTFDCSDLDGNTAASVEFRVWAVDGEGNYSFCEVTLRIVDSNGYCDSDNSGASLVGNLFTEDNDAVELAEVFMGEKSMMTGVDGQYAFDNNVMGLNYALEAAKNDNHLNGVSTLDLVLIQKHILGLDQLDSPFKVIAADINNDANVSAIDLVDLRKVILGITNEFTNNTSWRFGDGAQTFEDEFNPFPTFQEAINVDFLTADSDNDFIAIKVGDVSGNAIANRLMTDSRSNTNVAFAANDQLVNAGEIVSVSFNSNDFNGMNAFQFTLNTAGLEFTNAISGALEMSKENVAVFDGQLTAAWTSVEAVSTGDELFTLEFRALTDTRLSNAISMTSSITDARAYNSELERFNTTLVFNTEEGSTVGAAFELMQNSPNPFQNATTIGFNLGEAGPATLTVFDVTGKTVRVEAGNFDRGYNEVSLTKSELGTSGVLYYQLESGDFTATRKMILID